MAAPQRTEIEVGDLTLLTPDREELRLDELPSVQLVVLMRHRH